MAVRQELNRLAARFWGRGQSGIDEARRAGVVPAEVVVYLPASDVQVPEMVADALRAAFPLGRAVRGVDLLTGAVEMRFYYDATVLAHLRAWLDQSGASYDISYLY